MYRCAAGCSERFTTPVGLSNHQHSCTRAAALSLTAAMARRQAAAVAAPPPQPPAPSVVVPPITVEPPAAEPASSIPETQQTEVRRYGIIL